MRRRRLGRIGPTNNLIVHDDHIVLAYGRDYHDVSPIEGVLLGAGRQELEVEVDVAEAPDALVAAAARPRSLAG